MLRPFLLYLCHSLIKKKKKKKGGRGAMLLMTRFINVINVEVIFELPLMPC